MKKQEVFIATKAPNRGSYMSFPENSFDIMFKDRLFNITPGKKYKLTDVGHVNLQTGEKNYKFIDDKRKEDFVNSQSEMAKSLEFFDMNLVPITEEPK